MRLSDLGNTFKPIKKKELADSSLTGESAIDKHNLPKETHSSPYNEPKLNLQQTYEKSKDAKMLSPNNKLGDNISLGDNIKSGDIQSKDFSSTHTPNSNHELRAPNKHKDRPAALPTLDPTPPDSINAGTRDNILLGDNKTLSPNANSSLGQGTLKVSIRSSRNRRNQNNTKKAKNDLPSNKLLGDNLSLGDHILLSPNLNALPPSNAATINPTELNPDSFLQQTNKERARDNVLLGDNKTLGDNKSADTNNTRPHIATKQAQIASSSKIPPNETLSPHVSLGDNVSLSPNNSTLNPSEVLVKNSPVTDNNQSQELGILAKPTELANKASGDNLSLGDHNSLGDNKSINSKFSESNSHVEGLQATQNEKLSPNVSLPPHSLLGDHKLGAHKILGPISEKKLATINTTDFLQLSKNEIKFLRTVHEKTEGVLGLSVVIKRNEFLIADTYFYTSRKGLKEKGYIEYSERKDAKNRQEVTYLLLK